MLDILKTKVNLRKMLILFSGLRESLPEISLNDKISREEK